jgi:outer membrane lipoprotein LolB
VTRRLRVRRRIALLAAPLLLTACAAVQPPAPAATGTLVSGRLAVRAESTDGAAPRSLTAAFELQGTAQQGRLDLSTPLGSLLARAHWAPDQVVLTTPEGEARFADLDGLSREVLGESVPIAALFDWLQGRPWPQAPSLPTQAPEPSGFRQLGWRVDLARFNDAFVQAERERLPLVTVRAKLDRP